MLMCLDMLFLITQYIWMRLCARLLGMISAVTISLNTRSSSSLTSGLLLPNMISPFSTSNLCLNCWRGSTGVFFTGVDFTEGILRRWSSSPCSPLSSMSEHATAHYQQHLVPLSLLLGLHHPSTAKSPDSRAADNGLILNPYTECFD
jgi:hypothetical protein